MKFNFCLAACFHASSCDTTWRLRCAKRAQRRRPPRYTASGAPKRLPGLRCRGGRGNRSDRRPAAETAPGPGAVSQRGDDERDECLGDVLRVSVQIFHQGADHERLIWKMSRKKGVNLLSKWMGTGVHSIISQYIPVFFGHFSGIVYISLRIHAHK